ncbi:MAG TPA: hypothetical protein PKX20_06315 [Methanothrix soehngenii]|nr:hypothetical protein [Methanothrix soehngenii]
MTDPQPRLPPAWPCREPRDFGAQVKAWPEATSVPAGLGMEVTARQHRMAGSHRCWQHYCDFAGGDDEVKMQRDTKGCSRK